MSRSTRFLPILFVFILAAEVASAQSSEVPYRALRATAKAHAVVASFDRASFMRATAAYPADVQGRTVSVGVGNYMMWKIVHLFASERRVQRIALVAFEERCELRGGQYAETVMCRLTALVSITHDGRTRSANIAVNQNVGRFVRPKPGEDLGVMHSGLASTIDKAVLSVKQLLRQMGAL